MDPVSIPPMWKKRRQKKCCYTSNKDTYRFSKFIETKVNFNTLAERIKALIVKTIRHNDN